MNRTRTLAPLSGSGSRRAGDIARRRARERHGRLAEMMAACLLLLKGYRVLERRFRSRSGEIDLVAVRGQRLAFVEVKARRTLEAAEASIQGAGPARLAAAADIWLARNPKFKGHRIALDAIFIVGGLVPLHRPEAMQRW